MEVEESPSEELANSITHGIGVIFSIGALIYMIDRALPHSAWHVTGVTFFGISLIMLYLSSTIYHAVTSPSWKPLWRVIDHCFIFILIAGSYMPWLLVNLRGPWGWTICAIIWSLAAAGIVLKACFLPRFKILGVVIYILMGWLICAAAVPLLKTVSPAGLIWLAAGGLSYTGGVFFFLQKNLKYAHAIWHGFVLFGSVCHVIAVVIGVIPSR